jgi:DNA-directed RNA polymerase subunit RPC12/RpoP
MVKKYSCIECGSPFDAYPPDDRHDRATRNEGDYKDHIKVNYRCKDCGHTNVIFWGHQAPHVAVL